MRDPYAVLELPRGASQKEVQRARRRLLIAHHPDRMPPHLRDEADERVREINAAADLLEEEAAAEAEAAAQLRPGVHLETRIVLPFLAALQGGRYSVRLDLREHGHRQVDLEVAPASFGPLKWRKVGLGGAGDPPGDLLVLGQVEDGSQRPLPFSRVDPQLPRVVDELNLYTTRLVTAYELCARRPVRVTTPWATVELSLESRDRPGVARLERQRVPGHGVRRRRQQGDRLVDQRGDLFVDFELALPPRNRELVDLLRRLQPPSV
jgi:DnaJ-class molecular chaperone